MPAGRIDDAGDDAVSEKRYRPAGPFVDPCAAPHLVDPVADFQLVLRAKLAWHVALAAGRKFEHHGVVSARLDKKVPFLGPGVDRTPRAPRLGDRSAGCFGGEGAGDLLGAVLQRSAEPDAHPEDA